MLVAGWLAALSPACGGEPTPDAADAVIYEGRATDEALAALLDELEAAPAKSDTLHRAVFSAPSPPLTRAQPPLFEWTIGGHVHLGSSPDGPPSPPEKVPASWLSSALGGALRHVLSGVPDAYAHGTPFSGTASYLVLTGAGEPLRVFTGDTSFSPSAAQWEALSEKASSLRAEIVTADFDQNRVVAGPYQGEARQFEIASSAQ